MIFFTSDNHFYHTNVIRYCNRPFTSVEEMNEALINNWNSKVSPNDHIYVLGDHSFYDSKGICSQLNGTKTLIVGDHDKGFDVNSFIENTYLKILTEHNVPANVKSYFKPNNLSITLCHWCMRTWRKSHYNSWHLYAHSHGKLEPIGKSWDVGVDNNNFYPLSLLEVIDIMKVRPDNFNHHKTE
jgi:calcineurin-like phosphoesterase family protein